jgi:hypothetical protein
MNYLCICLVLHFQGNSVSTTKYSVLTFLPKGLFEQVFIHCFLLVTYSINKPSRFVILKTKFYFVSFLEATILFLFPLFLI